MDERRVRARELGIEIGSLTPGPLNAITDVAGVEVGQTTVNWGEPDLPRGAGPARTGVTVIWPQRDISGEAAVAAGFFALSGTGEMTARSEMEELGQITTPIVLTNTMNVGIGYDACCRYLVQRGLEGVTIPVVAECDDSWLHDAAGFHLTHEHVYAALDNARGGPVEEGCVGSGTGMILYGYKGGIGTSSRLVEAAGQQYTVGVLVMTNFGRHRRLTIAGVPVGKRLPHPRLAKPESEAEGSCIVVVATDAPLDGRQLARVAKRAGLGLGRTGSTGGNGSGELLMAFSTTYRLDWSGGLQAKPMLQGDAIDNIFEGTVDATEEAVLNALFMATTTVGRAGHRIEAIPLDAVRELL
ncbi:MAG: aminopeptidase [Chloroflexi bacterium]|nr:MAG: aminopeptidase [Chloroflexota bacterium]